MFHRTEKEGGSVVIHATSVVKFLPSLTRHDHPFILCPKYPDECINGTLCSLLPSGWQCCPSGTPGCGLPVLKLKQWSYRRSGVSLHVTRSGSELPGLLRPRTGKPDTNKGPCVCVFWTLSCVCLERESNREKKRVYRISPFMRNFLLFFLPFLI